MLLIILRFYDILFKNKEVIIVDPLKLENQLCFPLYAAAKEVIKLYTPFLYEIDLTYTQYITMMVIWEEKDISVKDLGKKLYLNSGTLTPLLKKLEEQGLINRNRSIKDERNVIINLTEKGFSLREKALDIPMKMGQCLNLSVEDTKVLYDILYKILNQI